MTDRRIAFVYPGQGSQYPGMSAALAAAWPEAAARIRAAAETLGLPELPAVMTDGPDDDLRRTDRTQPALFLVSMLLHEALAGRGVSPVAVAGHSLGEYVALTAAGALTFDAALALVGRRGRLMRDADDGTGAMAAVLGLEDDAVERAVADHGAGQVTVANYNAPGQVVISGARDALAAVAEALKSAGARRVVSLPVGGAFHSPMVAGAAAALAVDLAAAPFRDVAVPVVANVDGRARTGAEDLRAAATAQMTGSVRWTRTMATLTDHLGINTLVEVGPGAVLTGLAKRAAKGLETFNVATPDDVERVATALA